MSCMSAGEDVEQVGGAGPDNSFMSLRDSIKPCIHCNTSAAVQITAANQTKANLGSLFTMT